MRRFTDSEFCSDRHRKTMRSLSARVARDYDEFEEMWPVYGKPFDDIAANKQQNQGGVASTAVFATLILAALLVGSAGMPAGGDGRPSAFVGSIEGLRRTIRSYSAVRLTENFKDGLKHWQPAANSASDWSFDHGFVRPGRLRLWKTSSQMTDYQMEFVGQIEKKGLGWVYRAKDHRNYYASKISLRKPGPLPTADLVRYAVVEGRESGRHRTPLPLTLRNDTLYRVQVNVKGQDFSTIVNGQMVDTWSDPRLSSGAIGFFSEPGEVASLRWVTVSNRDNFVGRVLSYLGFWTPMGPAFLPGDRQF